MVLMVAVCCHAQGPAFQSPYKDGHAVADSLKDYSTPVFMNMLNSGGRKAVPIMQDNKVSNQQPQNTADGKTKPVGLSPAKKAKR